MKQLLNISVVRKLFTAAISSLLVSWAGAQGYTTANVHSHNDYEQARPFYSAWKAGFGSIEADIFLDGGELIVAHDSIAVKRRRTLEQLYLLPLQEAINENKGAVYADNRQLVFLVDIKTEAFATLRELVRLMARYPSLTGSASLKVVISGNRPAPEQYAEWPEWMLFDGEPGKVYTDDQWKRIGLLSANFRKYTKWTGEGDMPAAEKDRISQLISDAHQHKRRIRFWNAPDNRNSWNKLMDLGVDYINTDHIDTISLFLQQQNVSGAGSQTLMR